MAGVHEIARQAELRDNEVMQVFEAILARVNSGERVTIKGFGTFTLVESRPRKVTSPLLVKQGGQADVPAYRRLSFKASRLTRSVVPTGEGKRKGRAKGTKTKARVTKKRGK